MNGAFQNWVSIIQKLLKAFCPDQIELDAHVKVMRPVSIAANYMQDVGSYHQGTIQL